MLRIINAAEVRELLSMRACMDTMAVAMQAVSHGDVLVPQRLIMPLPDQNGHFFVMPGAAADLHIYGSKIVNQHSDNPARGHPAIQGFVALFDDQTGTPLAIIEGGEITAIRTAAASGLATRLLARRDATTHGIFGTGVQAKMHIDAINVARPCQEVLIWGRDVKTARTFAAIQARRTGLSIRATQDPEEAANCDIISTVTASRTPILSGRWLKPGCHVNLVGAHSPTSREADSDLIIGATVYTDLLASLLVEAGDVIIPIAEGVFEAAQVKGEIGKVISGELEGRRDKDEITVYKSLGITAQDLFAAHEVYRCALASDAGTDVTL